MTFTLVIGGTRSGKSAFAESLIMRAPPPWGYIATAEALDASMRARIAGHQARRGTGWETIEAPLSLESALQTDKPVLLDCLTLWLSNLLHANRHIANETARLCDMLSGREAPTIIVSSEVGLGITPENALARRFADEAGEMNQKLARMADHLYMLVAGHPLKIK